MNFNKSSTIFRGKKCSLNNSIKLPITKTKNTFEDLQKNNINIKNNRNFSENSTNMIKTPKLSGFKSLKFLKNSKNNFFKENIKEDENQYEIIKKDSEFNRKRQYSLEIPNQDDNIINNDYSYIKSDNKNTINKNNYEKFNLTNKNFYNTNDNLEKNKKKNFNLFNTNTKDFYFIDNLNSKINYSKGKNEKFNNPGYLNNTKNINVNINKKTTNIYNINNINNELTEKIEKNNLSEKDIKRSLEIYKSKLNSQLLELFNEEKLKEFERKNNIGQIKNEFEKKNFEKTMAIEQNESSENIIKFNKYNFYLK